MPVSFDTPIKTNDQSLDRVLAAGLPVALVFFHEKLPATLNQTMDKIARKYSGKLLVAQLSTADNPSSTQRFNVTNTPSLVTFREGKVLTQEEAITDKDLDSHVAYVLGEGPKPTQKQVQSKGDAPGSANHGSQSAASTPVGRPIDITDASFDQVVMRSPLPVLVDFWAPWCGPCRMTEPILEKVAAESADRLVVAKLNVDENPNTAGRYAVRSIPTMMLVKNGQIIDQWTGALPEPVLRQRLAHILN